MSCNQSVVCGKVASGKVDPEYLEVSFGAGVRLKRATFEITNVLNGWLAGIGKKTSQVGLAATP
jgi:hypothetical protein